VSNDVVSIKDPLSNVENFVQSSSVLMKCNQSVQTNESQNNPFFAEMYKKLVLHHGKIPLSDIVKENSGMYSRITQTLNPSVSEYLSRENCEKSTHSIISDDFSRTCHDVDNSEDSCNSDVVSKEKVEMINSNVHFLWRFFMGLFCGKWYEMSSYDRYWQCN
jgi:hypothetical protein